MQFFQGVWQDKIYAFAGLCFERQEDIDITRGLFAERNVYVGLFTTMQ